MGASRIQRSAEGILVYEDEPENPPEDSWVRHTWRFDANGWTLDPFNPPFELDPLDQPPIFGESNEEAVDVEPDATDWRETQVMVGPNGAIFTVSANDRAPGTRTTARWVDGKSVRLGREVSSLDPSSSFITGDGLLWNAAGGELQQFDQGLWETVAEVDTRPLHPRALRPDDDLDVQEFAEARAGHSRISPIECKGPPWLLRDRFGLKLWALDPKADGAAPLMSPLTDRFVQVHAAIPSPDGSLRLATENGLKTLNVATKTVSDSSLPAPPPSLFALTTDGLGRLWIGNDRGLGMVKEDGKTLESFDEVPWLHNQEVLALAPDPNHEDGVIVGLGWRGVMFIQVKKKP